MQLGFVFKSFSFATKVLYFPISSREYNGRYFHNIDAWKISKEATSNAPETIPPDTDLEPLGDDEADDLPF